MANTDIKGDSIRIYRKEGSMYQVRVGDSTSEPMYEDELVTHLKTRGIGAMQVQDAVKQIENSVSGDGFADIQAKSKSI